MSEQITATATQSSQDIRLSENAIKQVRRLIVDLNKQNQYLRVGVQGGGCSGLSYKVDFEEQPAKMDRVINIADDIKVLVDPKSFLYLAGLEMDYETSITTSTFVFKNPNAKSSCGCGTSFSI